MTDVRTEAQDLVESFPEDIDADEHEVIQKLETLTSSEFMVPLEEAVRTVLNQYKRDYGGDGQFTFGQSSDIGEMDVGELTVENDDDWFSIRGQVQSHLELTDDQKEHIHQRGVIGDDTGTTKYTIWKSDVEKVSDSDTLTLEEGKSYKLEGVLGNEYQGKIGIELRNTTEVTEIDEEFDPPEWDIEFSGCIIDVQSRSGLIMRCTEEDCTRPLNKGKCREHGDVNGEATLRLKGVIDNGHEVHEAVFLTEETEEITSISLEEAKEMRAESLDSETAINEMKPKFLGQYYTIRAKQYKNNILVIEFEQESSNWDDEQSQLLQRLEQFKSNSTMEVEG